MSSDVERTCVVGMWNVTAVGCERPAAPDSTVGLCLKHWQQSSEEWVEPQKATSKCPDCGTRNLFYPEYREYAFCENDDCPRSGVHYARPASSRRVTNAIRDLRALEARQDASTVSVVYYIRFGDRVKIGTSINLRMRLKALFYDEVLAVEQGGPTLESRRHRQFDSARVQGQREWFHRSPALVEHINQLRKANGAPLAAVERWRRGSAAA